MSNEGFEEGMKAAHDEIIRLAEEIAGEGGEIRIDFNTSRPHTWHLTRGNKTTGRLSLLQLLRDVATAEPPAIAPEPTEPPRFTPTRVQCGTCLDTMTPADVNTHGCLDRHSPRSATWVLGDLICDYALTLDIRSKLQEARNAGFAEGERAALEGFRAALDKLRERAKENANNHRETAERLRRHLKTAEKQEARSWSKVAAFAQAIDALDPGGEEVE